MHSKKRNKQHYPNCRLTHWVAVMNTSSTFFSLDAQTDVHFCSETFERKSSTDTIFAVQDEIAEAIVMELGLMIGKQNNPQVSVKKITESRDAYELYHNAQSLFHVRSFENLPEIITLYKRVVAIDPDFAEA
jgi:hypothetical protein